MRICYWSSDVCASDLQVGGGAAPDARQDVVELDQREIVDRPAEEPERKADAADHERHRQAGEQPERQRHDNVEIGRQSCRETVCKYVLISVAAVQLKKNDTPMTPVYQQQTPYT